MATDLDAALVRLEVALRAYGAPVAASFRPGLEPADIRRALAAEDLHAHEDVVTWWQWHDGAVTDASPVTEGDPGIYFRGDEFRRVAESYLLPAANRRRDGNAGGE
jgi:hypothetical protein